MKIYIKVYRLEAREDGAKQLYLVQEVEYNKQSIIIGRGRNCDLIIQDKESSRQHAIIDGVNPGEIVVIDLGSTNGTYVKNQKVARTVLESGDRIRIGSHEIETVFKTEPAVIKERDDGRFDPFDIVYHDESTGKIDRVEERKDKKPPKKGKKEPKQELDESPPSRVTRRLEVEAGGLTSDDKQAIDEAAKAVKEAAREAKVSIQEAEPFVPESATGEPSFATPTLFKGKRKKKDDGLFEHRRVLQVTMLWKKTVLWLRHYQPGEAVFVGESLKNDFIFPYPRVPERFKLLKMGTENCAFYFKPDMEGVVEIGGKRLTFEEMSKRGVPATSGSMPGLFTYELDFNDRLLLNLGSVQLFVQFVAPQPPIPRNWYKMTDRPFWKIAVSTTVVYLLCLVIINFALASVGGILTPEEEFKQLPERMAKLILEPPPSVRPIIKTEVPVEKPPEVGGRTIEKGAKGDEGEGARAKGKEGSRGRPSGKIKTIARNAGTTTRGPDTGFRVPKGAGGRETDVMKARAGAPGSKATSGARTIGSSKSKVDYGPGILKERRTISDEKVAMGSGILGVLGSGGGGGKSARGGGALAGHGLGGDVEGALKGLERGTIVDSQGAGGRGVEGVGTGGGGTSEGVGGLGMRGTGGGFRGTGLGTIGTKGDREVTAVQEELIYEGNLTADQIREVVNRHLGELRACYEKAAILNPTLGGKIEAYWEIDSSGHVQALKVLTSTLKNVQVESCMSDRIRRWQFPQPRGGGTAIVRRYPFVFRSL